MSGGHIKVRDYFLHCLRHPELEPYLYFTPDSSYESSALWADIPRERIVRSSEDKCFDLAFVAGKDWKLLSSTSGARRIIHFVQSIEQCTEGHPMFSLLKRPAMRICTSEAVAQMSEPHRVGEATVIENGIPLDLFKPRAKRRGSILIWGKKNPALSEHLCTELAKRGLDPTLLRDYIPREAFARQLGETEIFIGVPKPTEGFFLPALEAMASGCAVICPDAAGNRGFCLHEETCLIPEFDDAGSYLEMVDILRSDTALTTQVQRNGLRMAATHSLERERVQFHRFVDDVVLGNIQ